MAKSGSTSVVVTSWDTLKFTWSAGTQSIANNNTVVSWRLELVSTSSGQINSTASKSWSVTVNGTTYSGTNTVGIANNSTKLLASGSTTIAHNTDGTKTFSYSFSQQFGITFSGTTIATISGSGSGTLDQIARKSTLTASNGTLGTAQTLRISRASSAFSHTLTYVCGNVSGTIAARTTATSVSFTPPITLASQNTSSTNVSLSITLTTYNGNTAIGTDVKHITCAIPASVKPTITGVTIAEASEEIPSGFPYIQSKSKLKVTVNASGIYGSTITCKTVISGISYNGTTFTSNILTAVGDISIVTTVTDSRGRTATTTKTVTVYAYTPPTVTASLFRCDSAGNEDEQGEYMNINYNMSILPINTVNAKSFKIQYKKTSATTYTTETINAASYTVAGNKIISADSGSSYDIIVSAADTFSETKKNLVLSTAYTIFNIKADGKGICFGGVAEREGFEIKQSLNVNGGSSMFNPTRILNGANFDDIRTPGWYMQESNANTSNNVNAPEKVAFLLCVYKMTNTRLMQHFICLDGKASYWRYYRDWEPAAWLEWHQMTGEATVSYVASNSNYTCKKYTDGTMEISGGMNITEQACNTALGTWYRTAVLTPPTYIQAFVGVPDVVMSFSTAAGTGAMVWETNGGTVSVPPTFYLIRPTSSASVSGRLSIVAKGRWK